jgi:hypothetical protein
MDGVKSEPDSDSDRESACPQYEPQFIKIKEEHMADDDDDSGDDDDDDDDDNEEETSRAARSDDDLSDTPDGDMAEAVMFPIVKTEYHVADTSQKDAADEEVFYTDKNEIKVRVTAHCVRALLMRGSAEAELGMLIRSWNYGCKFQPTLSQGKFLLM